MDVALFLARTLLAVVFLVSAVSKVADLAGSRKAVLDFGVPAFLAGPLGILLLIGELIVAALLLPVATAWWGAIGAMALLLVFIAGISVNLARGRTPDCHCFGQLHSAPISWKTILRNGILACSAAFVILAGHESPGSSVFEIAGSLGSARSLWPVVVLVVAALLTVNIWFLLNLLQQNGRLLIRVEAMETRMGVPQGMPLAPVAPVGLPVRSVAPQFKVRDLAGVERTFASLRPSGKRLLLIFTEPGCNACNTMLPEVSRWQSELAEKLPISLISRGAVDLNLAKAAEHRLQGVFLQDNREVAELFKVTASPSAVLIDAAGKVASPVAAGADAIGALMVKATAPAPLKKGDAVPSIRLPDLNGKTFDLESVRGRRTLLLFWNPTCGFCQKMIDELKAWERNRSKDAPDLLVISTGSVEANRAQGFRSTVLLDQKFATGQRFGANGTPSALLLDGNGRLASDVAVGAEPIFTLAGMDLVGLTTKGPMR
jgi:thioredoxin-related protein